MTRRAWYADRPKCCEACGARGFVQAGHILRSQTVKREGGDVYSPFNRIWLCLACHEPHTGATRRLSLAVLPDAAFTFASQLLGPGKAYNALRREYDGADLRLDALLAEHEAA